MHMYGSEVQKHSICHTFIRLMLLTIHMGVVPRFERAGQEGVTPNSHRDMCDSAVVGYGSATSTAVGGFVLGNKYDTEISCTSSLITHYIWPPKTT